MIDSSDANQSQSPAPKAHSVQVSQPSVESMRRAERLEIARSITLIPVNPDGSPDQERITYGTSIDLTLLGVGFLIERDYPLKLARHVFGVEGDDGLMYYSTAVMRHSRLENGQQRIGAEFLKGTSDVIRHTNIAPVLNPSTMQMRTGLELSVLKRWEDLGVLNRSIFDRVKVCPACSSLPTMRDACKKCGSARVDFQRMIHHYACAHVDLDTEFAGEKGLTCPKCRAHSLVVGADFEYLTGPYVCMDCSWSDTTLEQYCNCLGCSFRFPSHQAIEQEVIGFSVERLDSLAFFNQS